MIIGCNEPIENTIHQRLNSSTSSNEINQRSSSLPVISRTTNLMKEHYLCKDLKKTNKFHRQESTPHPKGLFDLKLIGKRKHSSHQSNPKEELSPEKEEEDDDQPSMKLKSNGSVKSLKGKNYILKSDICKSTKTKSNFCVSYHEENPWFNYYDGIVNQKTINSNDYMFLVKEPPKNIGLNFNTNNYFPKVLPSQKEIIVEYMNNQSDYFEDDTVSVDVPLVFPGGSINNSVNLNNSASNNNNNNSSSSFSDSPSPTTGKQQVIQSQPLPNFSISNKYGGISNSPYQPVSVNNSNTNTNTNNNNSSYGNYMPNQTPFYPMNESNSFIQTQMKMSNNPYQNYAYPQNQNMMQFPPYQQFHNMNGMNYNIMPQPQNNPYNHLQNQGMGNEMKMSSINNNNSINTTAYGNNSRRAVKIVNNNYSSYSDETLAQYASNLIREQSGCRYVQEKVIADPHFGNNILFPYIKEELNELICDAFGNYLFQVLIDILTPENFIELFHIITPSFYQICISPHGTRVIQKILDKIYPNVPLVLLFKENLSYNLINICKDPYGNHIVQKYLVVIQNPHKQFIYDCVYSHFLEIANTKHGCCIIQKCLSEGNQEQRSKLFTLIHLHLYDLITDPFGNYTIQYIFSSENPFDIQEIIDSVLGNILGLCKQKYSSNVLEKCFENSNTEIQQLIIRELIKNDTIISELIADSYGNYVIQKALLVAKDKNYVKILSVITNSIGKIKKQSFGSKLIAKLLVTHKDLNIMVSNPKNPNNNKMCNDYYNNGNVYTSSQYDLNKGNNDINMISNGNSTWNNNQKRKKKQKEKKLEYKR